MPITISCYAFHPTIQRFVRIYRQVQVVSDWLAYFLSLICCQCVQPLPMSTSTSATSQVIMQKERDTKPTVDPGRADCREPKSPQCVKIDISPQCKDTAETTVRCNKSWDMVTSKSGLANNKISSEKYVNDDMCAPVHKKTRETPRTDGTILPALRDTTVTITPYTGSVQAV